MGRERLLQHGCVQAVDVVDQVMEKIESLRPYIIPADIEVTVTRDYGSTASEKSNELLLHMGLSIFGVTILILAFLGWRESIVVLLAIIGDWRGELELAGQGVPATLPGRR